MSSGAFEYGDAFSRNLGLVGPDEQKVVSETTVAIAGLGAVGGAHLVTLARMGFQKFRIADLDTYELANFNRQVGATLPTLDQAKVDVMRQLVLEINPGAEVACFPQGVTADNATEFLEGVDVAIDGLDYFAVDARLVFYRAARNARIPVVAAGPLGCSVALLVFVPDGMSWEEYFAMDLARSDLDRYVLFAVGTAPKGLHISYIDRRYVDLERKRGPSLAPAVQLCAGATGAEVMKLVLGRGPVYSAPYYQQFDAYKCRFTRGKLRWGNRGPMQRLKLWWVRRLVASI